MFMAYILKVTLWQSFKNILREVCSTQQFCRRNSWRAIHFLLMNTNGLGMVQTCVHDRLGFSCKVPGWSDELVQFVRTHSMRMQGDAHVVSSVVQGFQGRNNPQIRVDAFEIYQYRLVILVSSRTAMAVILPLLSDLTLANIEYSVSSQILI